MHLDPGTDSTRDAASPIVSLKGIRKQYGDHVVVDDVYLDVAPGEVVAIIGPSGAGKSTLLRCINLLERPDAGSIEFSGSVIQAGSKPAARDLAILRRNVGMVFQSFNLFPHMTVLRNVSQPQERVLKRDRATAEARARALLDRVGLPSKADAYPNRCSGGQQQRVAIARALALDPKVMLFDEPTSSLDPELGLEVLAVMRELANDGMTMVIVTHEMQFAHDVADRIVVMAEGRIIESGPPNQVMKTPSHERTRAFLRAVLER